MNNNDVNNVIDYREVKQMQEEFVSKAEKVIATRKEGIVQAKQNENDTIHTKFIRDFVKSYSAINNESTKGEMIDSIIYRKYVPFLQKEVMLLAMQNNSIREVDGIKQVDSLVRYINFITAILSLYTNLKVGVDGDNGYNGFEAYDMLKESGALEAIMSKIGKAEYDELKTMEDMIYEDMDRQQFSTEAYIGKQITRFGNLIGVSMSEAIDKIIELLNNTSQEDIKQFINNFKEELKNKTMQKTE